MSCIDPFSFFAEIGMADYTAKGLSETLNAYRSRRSACPVLLRLHGETTATKHELRWCGNDFLVVQRGDGEQVIVPLASVMSIAPHPAEPFSLFRSIERREPENLLAEGLYPQSKAWSTVGAATCEPIPGIGQFTQPVRFNAQTDWNRRGLATPVLTTGLHEISIVFRGTCSRICVYLSGPAECAIRGAIGEALHIQASAAGSVEQIGWENLIDGFKRLTLAFTPAHAVEYRIAVGDDGSLGHLDIYAIGLARIA